MQINRLEATYTTKSKKKKLNLAFFKFQTALWKNLGNLSDNGLLINGDQIMEHNLVNR